jgi:ribonuclease E
MKRMLINATQSEELRVALVDGQRLYDLDIDAPGREQKKANIYKGKITRIEPSLEAAFVDYGAERHGFLPVKEIARQYFPEDYQGRGRPNIKDVVKEGQEVIVQIDKEERGSKGAALTTFISLAGCYLVLMPNNPRAGGISRRIEGDERTELKQTLSQLHLPDGMGLIVRTAGVGRSKDELEWDLNVLLSLWSAIQNAAESQPAPFLIHQESDVITRAIRDYLRLDIGEILIDEQDAYQRAQKHISLVRPDFLNRVKTYEDKIPLFNRFQIESQIESAFQREVQLPSGGAIVIDQTEAFTCIDINSARATKGGDIEETALNTNKEAAEEIARQLRLRDIGGLVVIDYIDMSAPRHQREVENVFKEALKADRARVQVGRISRFGLLEMSRQRLRPSLEESSQIVCPRCHGQGVIRGVQSLALSVLRLIEDEAMKENTVRVHGQVPIEVATFLLNEKREAITDIEKRHGITVVIIPNRHFETPEYQVERVKIDDGHDTLSYRMETAAKQVSDDIVNSIQNQNSAQQPVSVQPAVQAVAPVAPPPVPAQLPEKKESLLSRFLKVIRGKEKEEEESEEEKQSRRANSRRTHAKGNQRSNNRKNTTRSGSRGNSNRNSSDNPRKNTRSQNAQSEKGGTSQSGGKGKRNTPDNANRTRGKRRPSGERPQRKPREVVQTQEDAKPVESNVTAPEAPQNNEAAVNTAATESTSSESRSSEKRPQENRPSENKAKRSEGKRRSPRGRGRKEDRKQEAGSSDKATTEKGTSDNKSAGTSPASTQGSDVAPTKAESTANAKSESADKPAKSEASKDAPSKPQAEKPEVAKADAPVPPKPVDTPIVETVKVETAKVEASKAEATPKREEKTSQAASSQPAKPKPVPVAAESTSGPAKPKPVEASPTKPAPNKPAEAPKPVEEAVAAQAKAAPAVDKSTSASAGPAKPKPIEVAPVAESPAPAPKPVPEQVQQPKPVTAPKEASKPSEVASAAPTKPKPVAVDTQPTPPDSDKSPSEEKA